MGNIIELKESPLFDVALIESTGNGSEPSNRRIRFKGTAARGGVVNENNRLYPVSVLNNAVRKAQERLRQGRLLGNLDHPLSGSGELATTAIRYDDIRMEGELMIAEGTILNTTPGRELAVMLEDKVGIGLSTRGHGSVEFREINGKVVEVIQENYELLGIDAVTEPASRTGNIRRIEHIEGREVQVGQELILEAFKKEHPEIVKQMEEEIKGSLVESVRADLEKEFKQKLNETVAVKEKEIKEAVLESEEVKKYRNVVESIFKVLQSFMVSAGVNTDNVDSNEKDKKESIKENELMKKLESLEKKGNELAEENAKLKGIIEANEMKMKVTEAVEAKIKGHRFEGQLRERLRECKTPEEVEKRFDAEVKFIESVLNAAQAPAGLGKVHLENTDTELDERRKRERKLAGLS